MTHTTPIQQNIWRMALVAAPFFILLSQFFWKDGLVTQTGGWLQVLAFTLWIPAFQGMFNLLKEEMPRYAAIGFLIAVYTCIGGAGFGFDGIYTDAMGYTSIDAVDRLHAEIGFPLIISLFMPGVLFPLSLLVLAIQLIRAKIIPTWVGIVFILAALGFPLSRMSRIDFLAHFDNVLLLISHTYIALTYRKQKSEKQTQFSIPSV
jgi:hypothetical protein